MCGISRSTPPFYFEVNPITHFGVISLFYQIFKMLILFVLYFKNYKRQVVSWNCKHVQHVKIYLSCNFEVNPITHFDWLCKLEKRGDEIKKKIFSWNYWANLNQTLLNWSLGGPLLKLCPSVPSCIQNGHHYKKWKFLQMTKTALF